MATVSMPYLGNLAEIAVKKPEGDYIS